MKTRKIRIPFKDKIVEARLRVTPFNMLPTERDGSSSDDIEKEKKFIRKHILKRTNEEVMNNKEARELLQKLGADLMIHTFACNFEVDGAPNEDIVSYVVYPLLHSTNLNKFRTKQTISIVGSTNNCHCPLIQRIAQRSLYTSPPPR
jgi:hypothetical protein